MGMSFLGPLTVEANGLFLLSGPNIYVGLGYAQAAVYWIGARGGVITGMEGLATDGRQVKPLLDYIADFPDSGKSRSERIRAATEMASRVVAEWTRRGGVQFIDFSIASEPEAPN